MFLQLKPLWLGFVCLAVFAGCRSPGYDGGYAQSGALLGTGLGATAGALIGSQSGHAGAGALIGAAGGLVTGALAGDAADARVERDQALAQAQYERYQTRVNRDALASYDVVAMSQSGVGDDVIISSIQTRGCRFSSDPETLIHLTQSGVSERVIRAMQNSGSSPEPLIVERPVIYAPPPRYVAPPPVVIIGRPYGRYHSHHYGHRRGCW